MALVQTLGYRKSIWIDDTEITYSSKQQRGSSVRLAITAPKRVKILRANHVDADKRAYLRSLDSYLVAVALDKFNRDEIPVGRLPAGVMSWVRDVLKGGE